MAIRSYRDLKAWQLGMELAVKVYSLTKGFPKEELYGLSSQMRRAAVAVPSNLSEGHPQSTRTYVRFLGIALGSLAEVDTQIELTRRLRLADEEQLATAAKDVLHLRQLLYGLRRSLLQRGSPDP